MGTNKVYLGWDNNSLRATVDASDIGRMVRTYTSYLVEFYDMVMTVDSDGEIKISISSLGLSSKPKAIIAQCISNTYTHITYQYDRSNNLGGSTIVLHPRHLYSESNMAGVALRFNMICLL